MNRVKSPLYLCIRPSSSHSPYSHFQVSKPSSPHRSLWVGFCLSLWDTSVLKKHTLVHFYCPFLKLSPHFHSLADTSLPALLPSTCDSANDPEFRSSRTSNPSCLGPSWPRVCVQLLPRLSSPSADNLPRTHHVTGSDTARLLAYFHSARIKPQPQYVLIFQKNAVASYAFVSGPRRISPTVYVFCH